MEGRDDVMILNSSSVSSTLAFTSYMDTALFMFGMLASIVSVLQQSGDHLQWAFSLMSVGLGSNNKCEVIAGLWGRTVEDRW